MSNMFPVLITYPNQKERVFTLIESADKLPVDQAFTIVTPNATPQMRDLAGKMYNMGWSEHKKMAEK